MPMTDDKIIDISETVVGLSVRLANLVIDLHNGEKIRIPLSEVAALIVSNPHVTMTNAVLAGVAGGGGIVVVSDAKFQPAGMMLPLDSHFAQGERFRAQAEVAEPVKKRLWQQIVRSKIKAQSVTLKNLHDDDFGLNALVSQVRSGDVGNVEARAAQRYWPRLFADEAFRRRYDADDQNRLLNYGYAVLRALTARAICGSGLHPSFGLHHHNRYDPFCLASDLMEPFRPIVDRAVARIVDVHGPMVELMKDTKREIIADVMRPIDLNGESRTIFSVLARLSSSLFRIFLGQERRLLLPEWG
ncbi:MAG TPA: type II CRISPR-associated endonuclease Cas1 [Spirochaetaceae bacterium]|nr:type II CRISPR-associated endonuclease Cas1 [Spirochaetaceae bacterium]